MSHLIDRILLFCIALTLLNDYFRFHLAVFSLVYFVVIVIDLIDEIDKIMRR